MFRWTFLSKKKKSKTFISFTTPYGSSSFHGAPVNVTAMSFMPFWGEEETRARDGASVTKYEGSDYRLLMTVAEALNFTIRVLPSKTWTEVRD